jgi:hypothetical protein
LKPPQGGFFHGRGGGRVSKFQEGAQGTRTGRADDALSWSMPANPSDRVSLPKPEPQVPTCSWTCAGYCPACQAHGMRALLAACPSTAEIDPLRISPA